MEEKRHLPPKDTRQAKAASPMEHGTPEKVLPVDKGANDDTPHFPFTSFQLIFIIYSIV